MDEEATPTLLPVPGVDLDDYKRTLIERFANPGVRDTVVRLCFGSSDRIPKWLLPVIRANLESGGPIQLSAATVASGRATPRGRRGRRAHRRSDQLADTLVPLAQSQRDNPTAFIENTDVFGDLASIRPLRRGLPVGAGLAAPRRREATLEELMRKVAASMNGDARLSSVRP